MRILTSLGFIPKWQRPLLRESSQDKAIPLWVSFFQLLQAALNCSKRHFPTRINLDTGGRGKWLLLHCRHAGRFGIRELISSSSSNPLMDYCWGSHGGTETERLVNLSEITQITSAEPRLRLNRYHPRTFRYRGTGKMGREVAIT